jgi:RNA polymerase sigma-70 factor (ECF subfamily)
MQLIPKRRLAQLDRFEADVLSHLDALYGVACRLTKSPLEAEDLVQDAMVKAIRAREQYQAGTNKFRRGGLERVVLEGPDADPLVDGWVSAASMRALRDPESQALRPIVQAEIGKALDSLPEEFRLAVVLSDVEELSYREIADVMDCPVGTVMSRLHRGRRMLQKKLFDHAVLLGIAPVAPAHAGGEAADEPVDIARYRGQKRGSA